MNRAIDTEIRFGQNPVQEECTYDLFIDDVLILTCGFKERNIMFNEDFGYTFESLTKVDLEDYDEVVVKEFMKVLWDNLSDMTCKFDYMLGLLTDDSREFAIHLIIAAKLFKANEAKDGQG